MHRNVLPTSSRNCTRLGAQLHFFTVPGAAIVIFAVARKYATESVANAEMIADDPNSLLNESHLAVVFDPKPSGSAIDVEFVLPPNVIFLEVGDGSARLLDLGGKF